MKVYYVGELVKANTTDFSRLQITSKMNFSHTRDDNYKLQLDNNSYNYIKKYLYCYLNVYSGIDDKGLINALNKIKDFELCNNFADNEKIIFEIIEDESGKLYGKELLTGSLFPLATDNFETEYFYIQDPGYSSKIKKRVTYTDENLARFSYILITKEAASENKINSYLTENKNNEVFKENIIYYSKENVFNKTITEKIKEDDLKQNELTKIMGSIEYLLNIIKIYDNVIYNKQKEAYNNLFRDSNEKYSNNNKFRYKEPTKKELLKFLSNLKLSLLICKNNCKNLNDYLNVVIEQYFAKIGTNTNQEENLKINDIDNIMECFLMDKDKYNILDQRIILDKINTLYILIIKNNIENITIIDLEKSYFKDNLESIYSNLILLYNEEIVEKCPKIEIKEISLENALEEIKKLSFKKTRKEHIKKLVK